MTVLAPLEPGELERLRAVWPNTARLDVAFRLARHVDACAQLLRGEAVAPELLDQGQIAAMRRRQLVRLEPAIDVLEVSL